MLLPNPVSELSYPTQKRLVAHLVGHGIPESWARDLVARNASCPVIESEFWILQDRDGKEVVRVPTPAEFG